MSKLLPYGLADEGQPFHFVGGTLAPIVGDFTEASAPEDLFTDVPEEKVELDYEYNYNSTTPNRVGTRRQPAEEDVQIDVDYGPSDSLTGTYDGSDRWTDPGDDNVRNGVAYKVNSTSNNKTGRVVVPVDDDVRSGISFEIDGADTGLLDLPAEVDVRDGVSFDNSNQTGVLDIPSINDVRLGVIYDNTTKTGNVRVPTAPNVKSGVVYDTNDSVTGAFGDGTAPIFAGVDDVLSNSNGSLTISWLAASDPSTPIRYNVYVKSGSSTGLFNTVPFCIENALAMTIFSLPSGGALINGVVYYVGVRALDQNGNMDTNTVIISESSSGVIDGQSKYESHGGFTINAANQLQGTLWATLDGQVLESTFLGEANYEIFDSSGTTTGISETGITDDGTGKYFISPVSSATLTDLQQYVVKIGIIVNGQERVSYKVITRIV